MSAERDDSVRAAADAVSAGKATKETVDALLGRPHPTADSAIERGPATPEDRFAELARLTSAYMDAPEEAMLRRAFEFARDAHAGQCRKSGEPFIIHPIEVGIILADLRMDAETITAALLHDTVEDTKVTAEEVERTFNPQVRALVEGVTKITRIEVESLTDEQAATIRKMFVAMSKDIRVIVIKLADRLHNMRTLAALREDRRIFKSRETLEIYAPIAHRLGINSIKWELEDLSFFYLEPNKYKQVSRMVTESRAEREKYLADVIAVLHEEMGKVGISAQIMGRPKHLYSIYQKMTKKGKGFSEIYDLIAVRIITSSVKDCYSALGAVHTLWHPMPGRFKDYIAMPKFNMYQSLHTTVMGPAGRPLEVQIRTEEMHRNSEYGVAAHWRYKETGASRPGAADNLDAQLAWLRQMVDWQDETEDSREFLKSLKMDLDDTEVFVFTPKGEVMSLRAGSTPVDFAYAIHTEVGNHCVGAKVNGSIVPLSYQLQVGDRVEVLTQKSASPSRDWLNIVKTPSARSKIRSYFSKITRSDDMQMGRDMLVREMRKHGLGLSSAQSMRALKLVAEALGFKDPDEMYVHIGTGKEKAQHVTNRLLKILVDKGNEEGEAHGGHIGLLHGHHGPHAHVREAPEEARDPLVPGHRGEGRRRRARAPVALLQPRARRRHLGVCDPRPRRVGAPGRLPQRARFEAASRAHHRGGMGGDAHCGHLPGGDLHRGARPHEPASGRDARHFRDGRQCAVLQHHHPPRWHGGDALPLPAVRLGGYRAHDKAPVRHRRRLRCP